MCPFCFGSVMLLAGSVVSVVSGGGFAAAAVKRFAERLESSKSSLNTTSQGGSDASQGSTKQNN
jgi:outer membrane lipoprotein-sorting protein